MKMLEAIRCEALVPFAATFEINGSYDLRSLKRLMKRVIHPHRGQAWLHTHKRDSSVYPHIHLAVAVEAEQASQFVRRFRDRVAAISKGKLKTTYFLPCDDWDAYTAYLAFSSGEQGRDKGNQPIYVLETPIAIECYEDL